MDIRSITRMPKGVPYTQTPPVVPYTYETCVERYRNAEGTTKKVIDAFGGLDKFCSTPFLKWDPEYILWGEYIDSVQSKDMSAPVMRGEDPYGRPFIALKTEQCGKVHGDSRIKPEDRQGVQTLFQRYSQDQNTWVGGHHYTHCPIYPGAVKGETLHDLAAFLQEGEPITAYGYHSIVTQVKLGWSEVKPKESFLSGMFRNASDYDYFGI